MGHDDTSTGSPPTTEGQTQSPLESQAGTELHGNSEDEDLVLLPPDTPQVAKYFNRKLYVGQPQYKSKNDKTGSPIYGIHYPKDNDNEDVSEHDYHNMRRTYNLNQTGNTNETAIALESEEEQDTEEAISEPDIEDSREEKNPDSSDFQADDDDDDECDDYNYESSDDGSILSYKPTFMVGRRRKYEGACLIDKTR